jgi:zinc transport system permease protein
MDKIVFSFLVAIVVAVSIKMIGMLLITSMLVIPSSAARLIAKNIRQTFWYAVVFSFVASLAGLIVSYYADLSTGATIIILLSVIFLCSYSAKVIMKL